MIAFQTPYTLVKIVLPLMAASLGGVPTSLPSLQDSQVKVSPIRDHVKLAALARVALGEAKYAEALEIILQVNAIEIFPENQITQAQSLVGLGRLAEAYGVFERAIDLQSEPENRYENPILIAYGDAARGTQHAERALLLYSLALKDIARNQKRGNPEGEFTAINPGVPRDPKGLQAASLALEFFHIHTVPGEPQPPKTIEGWLSKMHEIDRLAPNWNRIWPVLLWRVDTSNSGMKAFASAKLGRLANSEDPELRKSARMLRKYELHEGN